MDITRTSGKRVNAGQGELVTAGGNQTTVRKSWKTLAAVVLGLVLSIPGLAKAQFDFTTIDVPDVFDATSTQANANSTHEIAGEYVVDGNAHGFVLNKGVFTTINVPGAVATVVNPDVTIVTTINGINAPGRFTGTYGDGNTIHAFVWEKGVFTTLDPPGSVESQGGFLNAKGEVVGGYRDNTRKRHAFIWSKGVFTTIDPPNGHPTLGPVAFGINDPGQVVGTYVDTVGNRHGFLLSKGVYTTLDVPGADLTVAQGINNAGTIVGLYVDGDGNTHGFVLRNGVYTTIDAPDAAPSPNSDTEINSINAKGEIVGLYVDTDGVEHGFLGTPAR
jgi:probable HAF family extracellular repeat protein